MLRTWWESRWPSVAAHYMQKTCIHFRLLLARTGPRLCTVSPFRVLLLPTPPLLYSKSRRFIIWYYSRTATNKSSRSLAYCYLVSSDLHGFAINGLCRISCGVQRLASVPLLWRLSWERLSPSPSWYWFLLLRSIFRSYYFFVVSIWCGFKPGLVLTSMEEVNILSPSCHQLL